MCRKASLGAALLVLIFLSQTSNMFGRSYVQIKNKAKRMSPLSLCEVLRSPDVYRDSQVMVSGTYRVAYESSELYCLSCSGKRVWVDFNSESGKTIERLVHTRGTLNGTFTGMFHVTGGYGHLAGYQYELLVTQVHNLKLVDRLGLPPETLHPASRAKVCP